MKRFLNLLAGLVACVVILGHSGALLPAAAQSANDVAATRVATFRIDNMTCALCPITVRTAMEGVSGVRSVKVDYDSKTARVTFDPAETDVDAIAAASTNAGYPARPEG
jgi:mercuric ion binding protein